VEYEVMQETCENSLYSIFDVPEYKTIRLLLKTSYSSFWTVILRIVLSVEKRVRSWKDILNIFIQPLTKTGGFRFYTHAYFH